MKPYSVAPTYESGSVHKMTDHIRNADHISYSGGSGTDTHTRWTPPKENPGQDFARKVDEDYSEAKTVYWPEGQTPDSKARESIGKRTIKSVAAGTTIEDTL